MAAASTSIAADPVRQFSVFMENRVGRLHDLNALLGNNEVHVMAITVLDTTDNAIVRLIVDDPDKARAILAREDFPYHEADILAGRSPTIRLEGGARRVARSRGRHPLRVQFP